MSTSHPHGGSPAPARPRVLCLTNMWPGPADPDYGAFVREMCTALGDEGLEVEVAAIDRRGGGPLRGIAKYLRLTVSALARSGRAEVIYAHYLFPTGAIAALAGAVGRAPVVLTAHGQDVANLRRAPLRWASAPGMRRARTLIAVSRYLAERVDASGLAPERVEVIDMGVDMARFAPGDRAAARSRLGLPGAGPLVLAVGGLTPRKNPLTLLQAFARVRAARPGARLAFVGDGPLAPAVDAGVHHLLLEGAVVRAGAVEHELVRDWVAACDVLAMVSRVEPLGVAALEALAGGRPVVVTSEGGAREVVDGTGAGRVVDPANPREIADALVALLDDPPDPAVCRAAADSHSLARQAGRVAALLCEAAGGRQDAEPLTGAPG
jgi:glycosyltransferase involved in cell wall biosynthesis